MVDNVKKVTIKFGIDIGDMQAGGKLAVAILSSQEKAVDKVSNSTKLLTELDRKRNTLLDIQKTALDRLIASQTKINTSPKLSEKLALNAAIASVTAYNKAILKTQTELDVVEQKLRAINFGQTLGGTSAKSNNRGYVPNAQGTVTENRARAAKAAEDEFKFIEEKRQQALNREQAREEAYAIHQQKLAQETAARKLSILQNQIQTEEQLKEAARNRDLAQLKHDIQQREAIRQENIAKQTNILQNNLRGSNAALQADVDKRIAIERYGIKSIEVSRIEAANRTRQLQEQLSNYIIRQQERVMQGSISAAGATQRITRAQAQYTEGVLRANTALNAQEKALGSNVRQHDALLLRVSKLIISYNILRNVWGQFTQAIRNIPITGMAQQANQAPILAIFGTAEGQKNLKFVSEVAKNTGQDISNLETSYAKFATSAVLAGEKQAKVNKIFKNFAEVGAVFNLTQDKLDSVFLALDQMYGKSTVQSEELKKQLGNVLPGAVEIAAQAWASYTDSTDKSIRGFLAAMKKGEVGTKEFASTFSDVFRKIAGGAKDSVFMTIGERLNFQLGRLRNEYTLTNRTIFASTQRTMTNLVSITTTALTSVRENLLGIGQSIEVVASLLTLRLGVAAVLALGSLSTLVAKLGVFTRVVTGVSAPVLAAAGSVTYLYGELAGLSASYDKARGFTITFKDRTVSLTEYLEATAIITWQKLADAIKTVNSALKDEASINVSSIWDNLIPNKKDVQEFQALAQTIGQAIPSANGQRLNKQTENFDTRYKNNLAALQKSKGIQDTILNKATEIRLKAITEDFRNKSAILVSEAIADGRLRTGEEIKAALAKTREIAAPQLVISTNQLKNEAVKAGKAAGQGFSKEYLASLKKIAKEGQNYVREQVRELKLLDIAYGRNEVSLNSYFKKKKQLELDSIQKQLAGAGESLQLAKQNKDLRRVEEFEAKKQELYIKTQTVQDDLANQKYEALKQYNKKLLEIKANSLDTTGQSEQASLLRINNAYLQKEKLLRANNNVVALKQLSISKNSEIAQAKIVDLVRQEHTKRTALQNKEQSIQAQLYAGLISQRNGQDQILAAKLELLKVEDALISKLQQQVALNQGNVKLANQLQEAKARRAATVNAGAGIGQDITNQGISGEFGTLRGLGQQQKQLDAQISLEKNAIQNRMRLELASQEEIAAAKQAIDKKYSTATTSLHAQTYGAIASLGANTYEGLAATSAKMYGAQSKQARQAFLMYKAFKVAEIGIQIATNVLAAFGSGAAIPIAGIAAGPAFAAVAAALGAVQLAAVLAQPAPSAHGGLDYVPKEQTYLLDKGERVLSPRQNKDLTNYINNSTINNTQSANVNNIRIINAVDPSIMRDYIGSTEGEEVIMNVVRRNQEAA